MICDYCGKDKPESEFWDDRCVECYRRSDMKDSNELAYAKRIATSLWEKHWKEVSPDWQPIDDLMGVLTQIDNMTVGLHGKSKEQSSCTCGYERLTKCPVHTPHADDFPGPDDILRMMGKEIELYLSDWAKLPMDKLKATVTLLHKMLNASIFGWPEGELEKAHQMLDEISSMQNRKESPTETREEWISGMPNRRNYGSDTYYWWAMQQWFREEPPR